MIDLSALTVSEIDENVIQRMSLISCSWYKKVLRSSFTMKAGSFWSFLILGILRKYNRGRAHGAATANGAISR
jgi:hypothetical protein